MTEQYKNFCARFEYSVDARGYKVVAVTSSISGEGKTVSTVNLAVNLASTGRKKVLLIDLDLRKSDLAKGLRFPSDPGPGRVALRHCGPERGSSGTSWIRDFHVIPSGRRVSAPWEMISGEKFRILLKELRDQYDIILLDTLRWRPCPTPSPCGT